MRRLVWSSLIGQSLWRVRSIPRWIHKPQVLSSQCRFNSTDFQQSSGYLRTDISLIPQFGNNNAGNKEKEPVMRKSKIVDRHGIRHQEALIMFSYDLYKKISEILKDDNLDKNPRIAILCENDITYVIAQLAIWLYCGVGVPLCKTHPPSEWKCVIEDAQCCAIIRSLKVDLPVLDNVKVIDMPGSEQYSGIQVRPMTFTPVEKVADVDDPALIIYTSGTTGPPKGVVLSHRNLITNMNDMIQEWEWNSSNYKGTAPDIILHCLPLHHVHGVVNALWTPLFCGAIVYMLPRFNAGLVMKLLATSSFNKFTGEEYSLIWKGSQIPEVSIFMGVPTMYAKLIEYYEEHYEPQINTNSASGLMLKHTITTKFSNMRLMVSGSAALPEYIMKKWHQISGHWLLERYGMTEVGMALTNPLNGERIPGTVGKPFPSVKVKIGQTDVYTEHKYTTLCEGDHDGTEVTPGVKEVVGELLIKGPAVFAGYWNKKEASQKTFTSDGWFKTGDTAEYKDGVYSILGRTSVDIIKSGGYKISALDIERTLISHPSIADCAVVGLPDLVWGQKVAAAVVASDSSSKTLTAKEIRSWAKDKMANYKIPSVVKVMDQIPRNAMGKVNKKELVAKEFPKYLY